MSDSNEWRHGGCPHGWRREYCFGCLHARIADLERLNAALAERDQAREELALYRSRTYCAYCGYTVDMDADASQVSDHIRTCPQHPMRAVEAERDAARAEVERLRAALMELLSAGVPTGHDLAHLYGCEIPVACSRCEHIRRKQAATMAAKEALGE